MADHQVLIEGFDRPTVTSRLAFVASHLHAATLAWEELVKDEVNGTLKLGAAFVTWKFLGRFYADPNEERVGNYRHMSGGISADLSQSLARLTEILKLVESQEEIDWVAETPTEHFVPLIESYQWSEAKYELAGEDLKKKLAEAQRKYEVLVNEMGKNWKTKSTRDELRRETEKIMVSIVKMKRNLSTLSMMQSNKRFGLRNRYQNVQPSPDALMDDCSKDHHYDDSGDEEGHGNEEDLICEVSDVGDGIEPLFDGMAFLLLDLQD